MSSGTLRVSITPVRVSGEPAALTPILMIWPLRVPT
jgi:hypothetical protein